jgi:hypothetical protein
VSNCTYIVVDNLTVPGNTTLNLAKVGRAGRGHVSGRAQC